MWRISTTKTARSGRDTSDLASSPHDLTVISLDSTRSLPNLARSHGSWTDLTRSDQIWRDFADFCLHPIVTWTAQHNNLTGQTQVWKLPAQSDRVSCRLCTNPSWTKPWTAQPKLLSVYLFGLVLQYTQAQCWCTPLALFILKAHEMRWDRDGLAHTTHSKSQLKNSKKLVHKCEKPL